MKLKPIALLLPLFFARAAFAQPAADERNPVDLQFAAAVSVSFQGARSDTGFSAFQPGGRIDATAGALFIDSVGLHFGLRSEFFGASAFNGDRSLKGYASVGPQFSVFYRHRIRETETLVLMPGFQLGTALLLAKYELIDNRFFYPTFDAAVFLDVRPLKTKTVTVRVFVPFSAAFRRDVPVCLNGGVGCALLFDSFLPGTAQN